MVVNGAEKIRQVGGCIPLAEEVPCTICKIRKTALHEKKLLSKACVGGGAGGHVYVGKGSVGSYRFDPNEMGSH